MSDRNPTARGGQYNPRMTGASSVLMEDRNMLRQMERERRSQEVQQEETQYDRITPLFGEPFKRIKGDELSSRIQSMLGNYEDGCNAVPQESRRDSSRSESWDGLPGLHPPAEPLSPLQSSDSSGDVSPERTRSTRRPDVPPLTLPLNLHCKLANAKKPTAYVRPMDGQDQVTGDSPQLKASPESQEHFQDLKESCNTTLPPEWAVDMGSRERVRDILQEMSSWPPLLTSIHSPPKILSAEQESHGFTTLKAHESSDRVQLDPQESSSSFSDSNSSSDTDSEKSSSPAQPAAPETTHSLTPERHAHTPNRHTPVHHTQNLTPEHLRRPSERTSQDICKGSDWQLGRWLKRRDNQQNPESPCDVIRAKSSGGPEAAGQQVCFSTTDGGKEADRRPSVGGTRACENQQTENTHSSQHAADVSTPRPKPKRKKTSRHTEQKKTTTDIIHKQTDRKTTRPLLLVKIELNLLSRVPREPKADPQRTGTSSGHKRAAEMDEKSPKKKKKLDKAGKQSSSSQRNESEAIRNSATTTMMKNKSTTHRSSLPQEGLDPRSATPHVQQRKAVTHGKKTCKRRPVLEKPCASEDKALGRRQRSVEDHMKEAKKLKHKADATVDKMEKGLLYLEAALAFVESAIAMETEPQTPKSAYTMFSETLDLIRFILKLKNFTDPSAAARERDFFILCLRCQALLQMAMFRYRRDSALQYSRTLADHFRSSSWPASPSASKSGVRSPGSSGGTLVIPQPIQQVAASYVSITALFLSAHETWEQADGLMHTCSGLLRELDSAVGPLSLTSSVSSLVQYTRHGLQRIRLDSR